MNSYYKHKETETIFRVYKEAEDRYRLFKRITRQYFDGLWEFETDEQEIGTYQTLDECFNEMLFHAKRYRLTDDANSDLPWLNTGDELTFAADIIGTSGSIMFDKGKKVQVERLDIQEAIYGKITECRYPKTIRSVKLKGYYGLWSTEVFYETKSKPKS